MRKILSLLMMVAFSVAMFANSYWYRGVDNSWGATAMTESTDGLYEYIQSSNNANQFKIATSEDSWDYGWTYVQASFNSTDVTNIGDYNQDNCYCWQSGAYYILVYYPNTAVNTTASPIICAATTLPEAAGDPNQMYVWNGIGVTTAEAATELGGAAEAVQADGTNIAVGVSQKGNWCLKANKGFTSGKYYLGIAMNNGVNAGDTIKIAYFRTTASSSYVLGMDFSADKASAATTYQILSTSDPQVLASNGTPTDESFIVPEGVANAKYMRIYRNSGSTGLWVAKVEVVKKAGETPEQPEQPEENVLPVVKLAGSLTSWEEPVLMANAEDSLSATLTLNLGIDHYQLKVVSDDNWLSKAGDGDLYTMHRDWNHVDHLDLINQGENIKLITDVEGAYTFTWTYADSSLVVTFPEYIEPAKEYYAKYADAWTWVKMTEAEGLWLTDTIVYKGIGININDKAADENNMFYSNTVEEEGVRPIAGPAIDVNDTIYFTFNPADSVVTAVMVGKYVAPPTPDPTVAVMGSMNDWAEEIPFVLSADKTYASLTVENISAGEYDFKFVINGDYRSNGYRFHREFTGAAGITENNDANMVFVADQDGEYTFYWFFANDSAAIVYPEYIEPAKEYYAKYAPAWEWVKLTEAEGLWLTDTLVYQGIGININDKAADENNMFYSNTVEEEGVRPIAGPAIDVNDTIYFTFNPADSVVTAVMVGKYVAPVEETKDIVIVPGAWEGLHLGAWAWVDGEAGAWYPVVLDNEQLIATIPAAADRLIVATFAEGAELNWDNKINQTPDQVIDACGVLYINSNTPTWCEQGGFVKELYTIAGSGSILGVDWDQTAAINDMVFNAETGIYTLVKENLTLTAFEYQYKVAKDHVWNAGQYPASGNQVLAITEDGIYNVTFTFNPAIPLLTAEAEKIQDIVVEKHYLVVGQDMIANGEDWNNDTDINLMTTADEGLTYTLTVNGAELVADASYRYKIVEKGTWNEYFPNIGGDDASFTVEEDGIYTITYTYTVATSQCDVQATKTAELPEARLTDGYYIVGTFSAVDAWTVDDLTEAQRFVEYNTDEFGTYYSLTVDLAEGDQFKVVQIIHDAIVLWMPEGDGNNTVVDANHAGVAKNIYLNIMVNNTWDYSVEPNLYNGYYLLGTMNDWTPSADYMLGVDETCAEGELMLVTTFAQNDALKVAYVYNGVATQWYPGEGIADYVIDANHAGETSIYFRYDGQGSADWYYGFFYVIPLSHTDIDNVNAAGEATKILRDGQILILKGEKMYNVMGQTIK